MNDKLNPMRLIAKTAASLVSLLALTGCAPAVPDEVVLTECETAWSAISVFNDSMQQEVDASTATNDPSRIKEFLRSTTASLSDIDRLTREFKEQNLATAVFVWSREMGDLTDLAQVTIDGGQADSEASKLIINRQITKIRALCEPLIALE